MTYVSWDLQLGGSTHEAHFVVTTLIRRLFSTNERRVDVDLRQDVTNVDVYATVRHWSDVVQTLFALLTRRHNNVVKRRF